jgi:hypothetical protein
MKKAAEELRVELGGQVREPIAKEGGDSGSGWRVQQSGGSDLRTAVCCLDGERLLVAAITFCVGYWVGQPI